MTGFILKVLVLSALLSIVIKYGGPLLPVLATSDTALIAVWLPSLVLLIMLGWRWQQSLKAEGKRSQVE